MLHTVANASHGSMINLFINSICKLSVSVNKLLSTNFLLIYSYIQAINKFSYETAVR